MVNNYNSDNLSNVAMSMVLTILFFATLTLSSCGDDPTKVLDNKINLAIRSGNHIEENEWNEIIKYITENKTEFADLLDGETVDSKKLTDYILDFSRQRRRGGQSVPEVFNPKKLARNSIKPIVKVFIENSGSMDGYVRGIKDFEIVVGKLLVLCKDYCSQNSRDNFDVFFINKRVYPVAEIKELTDFARALEPNQNSPYNKGDRSESILNDVLRNIIDSTNENAISILVSDCIYSLGPTKDTKGSLGYQQNGTMEVFLHKFRQNSTLNFTTCIYKMESDYEGNYFPYDYDPKLKNSINLYNNHFKRPYYIWVVGENKKVADFNSMIKFAGFNGFKHSYILSNFIKEKQPYYTVLKETNIVGSFKPTERTANEVKSIRDVEFKDGTLQFAIAIDLGGIPVDTSYLTNPKNYLVPDGFFVKSINIINRNNLSPRDMLTIGKTTATHIVTVSTTNKFATQDLKLALSNKIPTWVEQSSSTDDRNVKDEIDKTFGLSYLVQGVSDAYAIQNPDQTFYFKIIIPIKN
ncbi:MAG: hypothetical protein JWQ09_234 [Segetibacter sp.]|nr:hypothetical protein [Segetibacter sp.]